MTHTPDGAPYQGAPPLPTETPALHALRRHLVITAPTPPHPDLRELLLRQAALWDRMHLEAPVIGPERAEEAAGDLMDYDRVHGTWHGNHGPAHPRWFAEGATAYTRHQYARWLTEPGPAASS